MKVTLILTVYNEADNIVAFLDSLRMQTRLPDEVIICDAGSNDCTVNILKSFASEFSVPMEIIIKRGNRSHGRNTAINHAKNEIIAGTDAGCILDPQWLECIIAPFEKDPLIDVVSGNYIARGETHFEQCSGALLCSTKGVNPDDFLPSGRSVAFRKTAWHRVRGFPEHLDYAEDTEFDCALRRAGCRFAFASDAIVIWRPRKNYRQLYKQYYNYASGDAKAGLFVSKYLRLHVRYGLWFLLAFLSIRWPVLWLAWSALFIPYWLIWPTICWLRCRVPQALWHALGIKATVDVASIIGWWSGIWQLGCDCTEVEFSSTPHVLMLSISDLRILPPAFNEGKMLGANGFQVEIITMRYPGQPRTEILSPGFSTRRLSLLSKALPKKPIFWFLNYIEFLIQSLIIGLSRHYDVVVAHNLNTVPSALIISKLQRGRLVYRAHELNWELQGLPLPSIWRRMEKILAPRADVVVIPNEDRAHIMKTEFNIKKIIVIQNCPPYSASHKTNLIATMLLEKGFTQKHIALFQGVFAEGRCTDELVRAASLLADGIVLVLLGFARPDYLKHLKVLVKRLGLEDRVAILDPVPYEQVMEYTRSADLGIVLYRNNSRNNYYCAPNKLFEYFMAGLPVVASNSPLFKRLVQEGGTGILVNPEEPKEIANAINSILTDPVLSSGMRNASLQSARRYNWEIEGNTLLNYYNKLKRSIV